MPIVAGSTPVTLVVASSTSALSLRTLEAVTPGSVATWRPISGETVLKPSAAPST